MNCIATSDKVQLVFLVDTKPPAHSDYVLYHRSLCLACTKILLYLNRFPFREHLKTVQWNYHFFSTLAQDNALTTKSSQFCEIRSELLENFFSNFLRILTANTTTNFNAPHQQQQLKGTGLKPVKLVYNALGAVVQDYIWDAPEIKSPVRQRPRGRETRGTTKPPKVSGRRQLENSIQHTRNYIFICSGCPESEEELRSFCVGETQVDLMTKDLVVREMFPSALLSQFQSKGISVHWIDIGMGYSDMGIGRETTGLSIMSAALKTTHGTLIPMSVLVRPLTDGANNRLEVAQENEEVSHKYDDREGGTVVHTSEPGSTPDVHGSEYVYEQRTLYKEPLNGGIKNTADKNPSGNENVDSSVAALTTSDNVIKRLNTRLNGPLKTILSSLTLPSASLLKDYLDRSVSSEGVLDGGEMVDAARDDSSLFWLCTKDGDILCILQLQSMYHHFPPNLLQSFHSNHNKPSSPSSRYSHTMVAADHGDSFSSLRRYSLAGAPLNNEKKIFSKSFGMKAKKKLNLTSNDRTTDRNSQATNTKDATVHGHMVRETHSSVQEGCDGPPCIIALGLVKQTDISLAWLKPMSVCSSTGLYVPRNIRETRINLGTKLSTKESSHPFSNSCDGSQSRTTDSTISNSLQHSNDADSLNFSPSKQFSKQGNVTTVSTSYNGLHLSPLIHLYRHPISPPFKHTLSSLARMRRSVSVPELCFPCSPSTGSDDSIFRIPTCRRGSPSPNLSESQRDRILKRLSRRTVKVRCRRLSVPSYTSKSSARCGMNVREPSVRSLSLSPRYPLLKLKDVLFCKPKEEVEMESCLMMSDAAPVGGIDPSASLAQSGHYHSKQYLKLCLWLAKHGLLLLVSVQSGPGTSQLALFQPITSLVSTLTYISPQHSCKLLHKLVNPPCLLAEESQREIHVTKKRCDFKGISSQQHCHDGNFSRQTKELINSFPIVSDSESKNTDHSECKPSDVLDILSTNKDSYYKERVNERTLETTHNQKQLFSSSYASDPDLYVSLQLLFSCHANLKTNAAVSSMFGSLVDLPPFTNLSLLPWFPYSNACGLDRKAVQRLQEFHSDTTTETSNKAELITSLKRLYSSSSPGRLESHDQSHDMEHHQDIEMEEVCPDEEQGEVRLNTVDELLEWFQTLYVEQVKECSDGDTLLWWVLKTLTQLCEHLKRIDQSSEVNHERLWDLLCTHVLRSSAQLGVKYEELSSLSGRESAVIEDVGNSLSERKIAEYLLQVLLHFEAIKLCSTVEIDSESMAKQLIFLLRKLSLLANPGLLGNSLKKIILPMYISSCPSVLVSVYEGLMLPLPSDLSSSPDFPSSPPTPLSHGQLDDEDGFDSEEERSLLSLDEPLAPKATVTGAKRLFRYQSFQEVNTQRQITIPSKAGRKPKKRKKGKSSNLKPGSNAVRRSPRIAKLSKDSSTSDGKGVCRMLFSRHHSLSGVSGSKRKREGEGADIRAAKKLKGVAVQRHRTLVPDILVKETPVKKQVENYRRFKLQRLRSKCSVVCSPGIEVIQESPQRSFYSVPKPPKPKKTPLFKTPPIKQESKTRLISPNKLSLHKEPSPAALHSLLHGHIVTSPHAADASSRDTIVTPHKHETQHVDHFTKFTSPLLQSRKLNESPDLFDAKEHSSATDSHIHTAIKSNNHRGTPSLISPDTLASYKDNSLFLLTESPLAHTKRNSIDGGSWRTTTSSNKQLNYRSARMLTYENENPFKTKTELLAKLSPAHSLDVLNTTDTLSMKLSVGTEHEHHGSSSHVGGGCDNSTSNNSSAEVVLVSPPSPPSHSPLSTVTNSRVCLLTDLDPSIETESASMMAFALCTPPKDEPRDFHQAFSSYQ